MVVSEKPLSRAQLADKYSDVGWREKLLDLLSLVGILRASVIHADYRPSEALSSAIALSESRVQVRTRMATQEKVNPKDAQLLALLGLVHVDPLIDVDEIDLADLQDAISQEIRSGALVYPMIFGRDLYLKAAGLFREERDYLNHKDTLKLLEGAEQGVFQAGHFLLGPFGIVRRPYYRRMGPTTDVPIQHCADTACARVHGVQLTPSIEAGVNKGRVALSKVLDQISDEPSEWNGFVSDITEDRFNRYEITESAGIEHLIGDAFSDEELARLAIYAAANTAGALTAAAADLGLRGGPKEYTAGLSRSHIFQLLLMLDNPTLARLLDSAVRDGVIDVPGDEIRHPRVNRAIVTGDWSLRPQLSRLGVRSVSADPDLPLLRLSSMVRSLFDVESPTDMHELSWILRGVTGTTADEQLAEFLRTSEPLVVIETLVLARRENAQRVCDSLGIDLEQANDVLRDAILWKLGFPLPRSRDLRDDYWQLHSNLESLAKTASVDLTSTAEGLRQASSDYFVSLEQFLFDSLSFVTWSLLSDHYISRSPFTYFEAEARQFAIEYLNAAADREGDEQQRLTAEPVLSTVVDGFNRLSRVLANLREDPDRFARSPEAFPKFAKQTALQKFPFVHVHPFLDLLPDAQVRIVETLAAVGAELNDSGIMTARNGLLHAKQRIPLVGEVEEALRKARGALDRLEGIGCVRSTFAVSSSVANAWGGSTTVLTSNGRSISFSSPSPFEWTKLPSFARPHYLVQGAVFARPNEMLRFAEGFDSDYQSYWREFPTRPEPGNRVISSQSESRSTGSETGSFSASRAG